MCFSVGGWVGRVAGGGAHFDDGGARIVPSVPPLRYGLAFSDNKASRVPCETVSRSKLGVGRLLKTAVHED